MYTETKKYKQYIKVYNAQGHHISSKRQIKFMRQYISDKDNRTFAFGNPDKDKEAIVL